MDLSDEVLREACLVGLLSPSHLGARNELACRAQREHLVGEIGVALIESIKEALEAHNAPRIGPGLKQRGDGSVRTDQGQRTHASTSRSRSRILATCFSRSASISARGRGGAYL